MDTPTFEDLGLGEKTLEAIRRKGFEAPTPIQALTIPRLLNEKTDLIARAMTGTGKTAAFGLPLVDRLTERSGSVEALVLEPTRELALQVTGELDSLRSGPFPRVTAVYGGSSMGDQFRHLRAGVEVVVGTPGRVLDHINRGSLDLSHLKYLILDEADEMLDMGFVDDIEEVLGHCGEDRRVLLFSATMPEGIMAVARKHFEHYETVEDSTSSEATQLADQFWIELRDRDRLEALCRFMDAAGEFYGIVFTTTKLEAQRLAEELENRGYNADSLHGDLSQDRREQILARFRAKKLQVLVATDVAARGIDIEKLSHVVNWSLPYDPETYVHRVGRTGRAGNEGIALTFVSPDDSRRLYRFKHASGDSLKRIKVPSIDEILELKRQRLLDRLGAGPAVASAEETVPESGSADAETAADGPVSSLESDAVPGTAESPASDKDRADSAVQNSAADAAEQACDPDTKLWNGLAGELIARLGPEAALARVLRSAYGSELDRSRYHEIAEPPVRHGREGGIDGRGGSDGARLFVGAGRKSGASPARLASLMKHLTGLPDRFINNIEVYETFSFLTLPSEAADKAIAEARHAGGDIPPIRLASPRGEERPARTGKPRSWSDRRPEAAERHGDKKAGGRFGKPKFKHGKGRPPRD